MVKTEDETGRHQRRICLLTSSFPRWQGDSTTPFVLHLAQDLIALSWDVEVLAPHAPGAARQEVLDGVPVRRFRYLWPESQQTLCYQGGALPNLRKSWVNWLKAPLLVASEWLALVRLLAHRRYDLINAHWVVPQGFVAIVAGRLFRVPVVITVHGGDVFSLNNVFLVWFKRFSFRYAAAVTVNSSATEQAVLKIAPGLRQLHRIPMGVSPHGKSPDPAPDALRARYGRGEGPLLIFVGRLVEEKGVGDLLRATLILSAEFPNVGAMIVGEGPDRRHFEALAQNLGIADRVHFLGWVEAHQVPNYMAASDVLVGPSKRAQDGWIEAQGLVFAEAMLADVPVVATRSGGIPDLVRPEETGLLVDEGSPEQIAAAVRRIIQDPELTAQLTSRGRAHVRQGFTRARTAEMISNLLADLRRRSR